LVGTEGEGEREEKEEDEEEEEERRGEEGKKGKRDIWKVRSERCSQSGVVDRGNVL
jgi:hypothetical protein